MSAAAVCVVQIIAPIKLVVLQASVVRLLTKARTRRC